jgi:integrase
MLSPDTYALLREWWQVRSNKYDLGVPVEERWLFPGRRKGMHLTERQVSRLFQEAVAAAGLMKKVTLHTLRHSFATHLYDQGVDSEIRRYRPPKLEATARYARLPRPHHGRREPARSAVGTAQVEAQEDQGHVSDETSA